MTTMRTAKIPVLHDIPGTPLHIQYFGYRANSAPEDLLFLIIQAIEHCHEEIMIVKGISDPYVGDRDVMWDENETVIFMEVDKDWPKGLKWSWVLKICVDLADFWQHRRYTDTYFNILKDGDQIGSGHVGPQPFANVPHVDGTSTSGKVSLNTISPTIS